MSNKLPNGWVETDIGKISDRIHYGYTAKSNKEPIGTKLLRITDIQNSNVIWGNVPYCKITKDDKKKYLLETDDLVFARTGATVGKSYLMPRNIPESVFASYLIRVILNSNISPKFVYNFFQTNNYWIQIKEGSAGIGQPNVNATKLSNIKLPIPPFPEQNRIVSKIEELVTRLDAGIESLKQVQILLKKYRQSVLKSAVEGKLTSEWRKQHKDELEPADKLLERILKERKEKWEAERLANFKSKGKKPPENWQRKYKEPTLPDKSNLPELPEGWVWVSLETLSNALGGYAFKSKDYSEKGYQIIKIGNVKMNSLQVDKSPCFIKNLASEIIDKYQLKKKDILITLTGTRKKRDYGFVAMVGDEKKLLLNQRVARLNFLEKVKAEFYLIALQSEEFRDRLFSGETGNVGQGNIGMGSITKEAIPLPSINEQNYIVSECQRLFSIIDESEKIIEAELKRSQSLRQSILKKAFEGKLVPQDPNDEPASVLLERIMAEKSNPKKAKQMEIF